MNVIFELGKASLIAALISVVVLIDICKKEKDIRHTIFSITVLGLLICLLLLDIVLVVKVLYSI